MVATSRAATLSDPNDVSTVATQVDAVTINGKTFTTTLDADGNLSLITAPLAKVVTFGYDAATRVTEKVFPDGESVRFGYDASGNLDTLAQPGSPLMFQPSEVHSFQSEPRDMLSSYAAPDIGLSSHQTLFGYTADRQLDAVTRPDGLVVDPSYDAAGRLDALGVPGGLVDYSYFADTDPVAPGKLERIDNLVDGVALDFGYAGALLTSTTWSGPNGNGTSVTEGGGPPVTASYDAQDRLVSYGGASYGYSAAGELQSKTDASGTTGYAYDVLGNLRSVSLPTGTTVSYVVDGLNRRVAKKVDGVMQKAWLYGGAPGPIAELGTDGATLEARFVYGTRGHVPDYMVKGGSTCRFVTDQLGSVRLVVDAATGIVAQRLDYDAWGKVLLDTNPGFQPFGFAGGLYDPDTGLVRFGARDYDAEAGRWTTKDPIGFGGGQPNLYEYAQSDSINRIDPNGLVVTAVYDISDGIVTVYDWTTFSVLQYPAKSGFTPEQQPGVHPGAYGGRIPFGEYAILNVANKSFTFRLDPVDSSPFNDRHEDTGRTAFRMHHMGEGITFGCVSPLSEDAWTAVEQMLNMTSFNFVEDRADSLRFYHDSTLAYFGRFLVIP